MESPSESEPLRDLSKLPCPDQDECGSSDAFTVYDDGHGHCFSCGKHFPPTAVASAGYDTGVEAAAHRPAATKPRISSDLAALIESGSYRALGRWKINQETCQAWGYLTRVTAQGDHEHLAVYKDEHGAVVDVKVRNTGKDGSAKKFYWASGKAPKGIVYGANRLGNGGKVVCIAMGEKDCLTVSQLWGNKFPVISPANGESGVKDIAKFLPQLIRYDKVVIVQDMDEPGLACGQRIARMLPPGKAYLCKLPYKDANETLLKASAEVLISAIHNAAPFRPDGIVDADELDGQLLNPTQWGMALPWKFMTDWTYGMRGGEVWVMGAGTGVGKSDFLAEVAALTIIPAEDGGNEQPTAIFDYESAALGSLKRVLGKIASKRFNIPDPEDGSPNLYWTAEELETARVYRREKCAKLYINDHKGAIDWASVKERLRYLRHEAAIKLAIVDPVAALVAQEDDDRKALDRLFAEAKALAEELDITIFFASHLTRPSNGDSHEEGGRVELRHFRGSGAIVMWASFVLGLERNQQGDEEERKDTTLRVLKDRFTGDSTGKTRNLVYNVLSGRLEEAVLKLAGQEPPEPPPL